MLRLQQVTGAATTRFLWDGDRIASETDGSNAPLRRFVYGPDNVPLVWYEGSGTGTRRWLHTDERGSVIGVSDAAGALVGGPITYDEYGIPASIPQGLRFAYAGQIWLPEIGLSYARARMYSPTLGRFMQTDPVGYADGLNWYNYAHADPVNKTDPSGLGYWCGGDICADGPKWYGFDFNYFGGYGYENYSPPAYGYGGSGVGQAAPETGPDVIVNGRKDKSQITFDGTLDLGAWLTDPVTSLPGAGTGTQTQKVACPNSSSFSTPAGNSLGKTRQNDD